LAVKVHSERKQMTTPRITVIVCTYNRSEILRECLGFLAEQTYLEDRYEVIVVDNNSTDSSREIAREFSRRYPNFRVVSEPKQGLSHARNRGWHEAKSEWVAYVDDDCRVPGQWLESMQNIIAEYSPAIFGGPYYPFFVTPRPRWYKDAYGSHVEDTVARPLKPGEYLSGGNIIFSRNALEDLGGFDPNLGMSGDSIAYGEETALQIKTREVMPQALIYYDPALFVYHMVPAHKMTLRRILLQHVRSGISTARMLSGKNLPSLSSLVRGALLASGYIPLTLLSWLFNRDHPDYPYFENYLIERIFPHIRSLSHTCALFSAKMSSMIKGKGNGSSSSLVS